MRIHDKLLNLLIDNFLLKIFLLINNFFTFLNSKIFISMLTTNSQPLAKLNIFSLKGVQMKTFHVTWLTFFFCFFAWFGMAPLMKIAKEQLHHYQGPDRQYSNCFRICHYSCTAANWQVGG
jgi:hypothetical protein